MSKTIKKVAIIMGSKTDHPVMSKAQNVLQNLGIPSQVKIVSAHRTPKEMVKFATHAHKKFSVIIAGAGGAAHLPGMVASLTTLPVIGVPVTVGSLKGLDALLSIAQMPKGIPVATVAIDNAENAGLLAARIIGVSEEKVRKALKDLQISESQRVSEMNRELKAHKRQKSRL